jgi:hypothetical protein
MTIEEIEALIQGYLEPNDVNSDDFLRGRSEGHADIACALTYQVEGAPIAEEEGCNQ